MTYRMKCVITNPQEPFFTEGKEYQIAHNGILGYFIKDDDGTTAESGKTRGELLNRLNEYWYSQFELIEIEPKQSIDEHTEIRKKFQQTLIQYNMDIEHFEGRLVGKPSNIISAQVAMLKVKREAIQELYGELFKEDN
ncbi:hypothetical protein [Enterococcus phage vB_EfaM_Ef2.3]|uniref:Uncharacterized protein n=2 Tax=Kochikohdavirus TaxID=2560160 RepID=A0A9E7SG59_9CAUD|nr:hypothetical protein [Enterococcus phage vB_EfaM_Ef2.3]USL84247.1 hypothetical protein Sw5_195 [Enterococcus phage Sw5]BBE37445.1 hypothetical protein PHIM1EF22_1720 [Enterococcus phage phiM1EF22]